jgi:hypothetical protein
MKEEKLYFFVKIKLHQYLNRIVKKKKMNINDRI